MSVAFVSLGCAKNLVDSERMLAVLGQGGYVVGAPQEEADVIVVNTCGFLAEASEESYEVIRQALSQKKAGPCTRVVVAGCLASRYGRQLLENLPGIDAVVGVNNREDVLRAVAGESRSRPLVLTSQRAKRPGKDVPRVRITASPFAYLRISEGCSQHCSFCTIPSIRGPFRSKPDRTILREAKELLDDGVVELDVIGQDTSSYGQDLPGKVRLAGLLAKLDKLPGLEWLRVLYAYPSSLDRRVIKTMAESEHVVHYLDLPLQHISDRILRRMGRRFSRAKTERLIDLLFSAMPDLALRTTIIVGFPGETDAEFAELLNFVRQVRFTALGAFAFSPEQGTRAAGFAGQVPDEVKQERLDELMRLQQQIALTRNESLVGQKLDVLIEQANAGGQIQGRYYAQGPEVDSVCYVRTRRKLRAGQIIWAEVTGYDGYDLKVRPVQ